MNIDKLETMLVMQDRLNKVINLNWVASDYPWHRAMAVEAVEALEHYGWKWWKAKPEPDVAQIQLELVDIWHFAMSLVLSNQGGAIPETTKIIWEYFEKLEENPDVYGEISTVHTETLFDLLIGSAGIQRQLNGPAFNTLMKRFDLDWNKLYTMYIGKNVLNLFRQANGYKDGTYIKFWGNKEDNEVLASLMERNPNATPDQLMELLDGYYQVILHPFIEP